MLRRTVSPRAAMADASREKDFFATTTLDLSGYTIDLIVGGEGMSECLRDHLLRHCRSVVSSYGASDLDINVGIETPFTLALRRRCENDPALCCELFGRDYPPMLFQYNPHDYIVESLSGGELAFTVARPRGATPRIRYNLHDLGGVWKTRDLDARLAARGISPRELSTAPRSALPLLYVFGRSDMTVPFYGAKVFASDIEQLLAGDPILEPAVHSFQLSSREEGASLNRRLYIALESVRDHKSPLPSPELLRDGFYEGLRRINQDFREVSRLFERSQIEVKVYPFETGPFADMDKRLKNRYIAAT